MNRLQSRILVETIDGLSYGQWLEARRSGIGGSDVAAALGMSVWKSAFELWEEKALGKIQPIKDSEPMLWGRLLEPLIKDEFAKRTKLNLLPCRALLQAQKWPWMLANLDGLIDCPERGLGVLEVKTTSTFRQDDWAEDRCPDAYALQTAHYLAVTGLSFAVIAVLIGGSKLQWVTVQRDEDLLANLVNLERVFWERVLTKTPPPVDGSEACTAMLAGRYPASSNAAPLILPPKADGWIQDYQQAKADLDAAEERKRLAENQLKEAMRDHEKGVTPTGRQVLWKTIDSSRVDTARLKKEEPALFEKFSTTSSTRRFSVSPGK